MEAQELRKKSVEELNDELVELRKEQFKLRMSQATGELNRHTEHGRDEDQHDQRSDGDVDDRDEVVG